jgi:hypothetical protein
MNTPIPQDVENILHNLNLIELREIKDELNCRIFGDGRDPDDVRSSIKSYLHKFGNPAYYETIRAHRLP